MDYLQVDYVLNELNQLSLYYFEVSAILDIDLSDIPEYYIQAIKDAQNLDYYHVEQDYLDVFDELSDFYQKLLETFGISYEPPWGNMRQLKLYVDLVEEFLFENIKPEWVMK